MRLFNYSCQSNRSLLFLPCKVQINAASYTLKDSFPSECASFIICIDLTKI